MLLRVRCSTLNLKGLRLLAAATTCYITAITEMATIKRFCQCLSPNKISKMLRTTACTRPRYHLKISNASLYHFSQGVTNRFMSNQSNYHNFSTSTNLGQAADFEEHEGEDVQDGETDSQEEDPFARFPDDKNPETGEVGGPTGPEPTRYGDWERKGRVTDF